MKDEIGDDTVAFLASLFPNGISSDRVYDALVFTRIFEKMKHIASGDPDPSDQDPYQDIADAAMLGMRERNR